MSDQPKPAEPPPGKVKCPECNGRGEVLNPNAGTCDSPWMTCPVCHGDGVIG